jgi:hypothetical protein
VAAEIPGQDCLYEFVGLGRSTPIPLRARKCVARLDFPYSTDPPYWAFANLNQHRATTHFNGQSTVRLDGDHAAGEGYRIAHHLTADGEKRTLMPSGTAHNVVVVRPRETA